jgi:hypothetical protein
MESWKNGKLAAMESWKNGKLAVTVSALLANASARMSLLRSSCNTA